jgi:hypothetical protein
MVGPMPSDDDHVFSEQEVGEIVQRAAKLQETSAERGLSYTPGVTREQLERVAAEVGVEREFLDRAISERLSAAGPGRGLALRREEERIVAGELDPSNFDLILTEVRARGRRRHPAAQIGRTLQAQVWTGAGLANLQVTSRNERTRIRLRRFPLFEILGTLYPTFMVSVVGGSALASAGHAVGATVAAAASVALGAFGFRTWMRASDRRLARTAAKLEGVVAREVARQAPVAQAREGEAEEAQRPAEREVRAGRAREPERG